jgi:hypothetical protein
MRTDVKLKTITMKNLFASLILLSLIICSCEKDGDVPNYVGIWSMEQSIDFMGITTDLTINMEIKENSVESIGEMTLQDVQIPAFGNRADLVVDGQKFIMTLTSIGAGDGTGGMIWVDKGGESWEEMLTDAELTESIEADYLVVGNKLTLNIEGGVPQVYTRQ